MSTLSRRTGVAVDVAVAVAVEDAVVVAVMDPRASWPGVNPGFGEMS
jgi:hypothetical protein